MLPRRALDKVAGEILANVNSKAAAENPAEKTPLLKKVADNSPTLRYKY